MSPTEPTEPTDAQRAAMLEQWANQQQPQPAPPSGGKHPSLKVIGIAAAVLVGVGLVSALNGDDDKADRDDTVAIRVCGDFAEVAHDYADGIMTLGELHDRMADIASDAEGAEGVRGAKVRVESRRLLAALTSNLNDAPAAIRSLDAACQAI